MTDEVSSQFTLQRLRQASEKDRNDSRNLFVPRRALKQIIDRKRVEKLLETLPSAHDNVQVEKVAEQICPEPGGCFCKHDYCTGGRMIFATLLLLGREDVVFSFLSDPHLCDCKLPLFTATSTSSTEPPSFPPNEDPAAFKCLYETERKFFAHFQWQVFTPFFNKLYPGKEYNKVITLPEAFSLPWQELERVSKPEEWEQSYVEKVKIFAGNHALGPNNNDVFALKTLEKSRNAGMTPKRFQQEIKANSYVPKHERIVPLLAAYKYREKSCLVFPFADRGNLQEVWKRYSPANIDHGQGDLATWYSEDWLLEECFGIADALAVVHGLPGQSGVAGPEFKAQIHTDIKPVNILCFKSYNGEGERLFLKLADFGEAKEIESESTVKANRVPHVKTYRPPEYSPEGHISPNYDVWCLGCLFLEFVTWALKGWNGIKEFSKSREEEQEAPEFLELIETRMLV
ncbi:hypothetical protein VP1G_07377 [Cytospora mali]|uniref:Protein kinase domain-containing protein n=1 Tax=Cytospora mali TaxID=578113 RepID=A0A194V8I5_CYTMA|nr:hypothetical protein VP1G_07377 [Valsa mali var. pyri (nom. inval.)]